MSEQANPGEAAATRREFLTRIGVAGFVIAGTAAASALPGTSAAAVEPNSGADTDVTVLNHATVIDATGAPPRHDMSVVLMGNRIVAVEPCATIPPVPGGRVVDVRGKFVIPGMWDMHTHMVGLEKIHVPLYVANGITGIREMAGAGEYYRIRDQITSGELLGPRMTVASAIVDGAHSWPGVTIVNTEAEARQAVRTAKQQGADFIKVYSYLARENYFAIADEAKRLGIQFAGHLPERVSSIEASDAGQRSFEHLYSTYIDTSSQRTELRRQIDALPLDPANPRMYFRAAEQLERAAVATYDPQRADELFARFRRNGTWQTPTLTVLNVLTWPTGTFDDDPRMKYLPSARRESWKHMVKRAAPATPEQFTEQRTFFQARQRLVGTMRQAGVGILAGTDTGNPYCFPGFSLHDELVLLVQSGLTPMQALQSATRDAARYLGVEHSTGTVTAGKSADLLVLDANPLDDIANTQRIHAIVIGGRLITRAQRERMLADVEAAANAPAATEVLPTITACPCYL